MAQWGSKDQSNNAPRWAPELVNRTANTTTRTAMFGNTTGPGVFAVDVAEVAASDGKVHSPGWVLRTTGTGGRAGRVFNEVLVVARSISLDSENTVFQQVSIKFDTQPASKTVATGTSTTIGSIAASRPAGAPITYIWQANTGAGFNPLVVNAVYTNVTSASLPITNTTGLNGVQYRAVASTPGANNVTSRVAVLTVA
jgi:hypothetical protein